MSVAEQAIADSRRILEAGLLDIFFPDASGNVLAASNADFYNAFLNLVGGGEAYRNRDGSVRQNLSPRIRAAVLAAMLNPERRETVERLLDNPEGYNALINGLMQSAANLAELANKPEYDLSGELSQAVELFVETRDKGQTVDEFAAQTDMFRDAPSAETMFLMRLFEENAKSSGGISGVLRQYAAECKKIDTTTQSLFGEENPTKLEKLEEAYRHYAADLSNEAGNGNLRWRDTGEPAAEEISEAQKQYEEVKSKYMGTPLWMKAPNGKRTNLTEEQWVRVRTANFKRWFGDWEKEAWAKAAMDFLEKTAPVRELSGGEFQKDGVKLTEKVPAYFKSIGNVAHNDELGDVVLDLKGVEDSIAHGIGRLKSAAFMAVPDVIEKGFIFNREENWKERGWNTAVIVAPIKLGEDDYVCEVVVKKVRGQQRFYLHEVEIKKTLDGVFKSVANNGNASQVSKLILGKHLAEVKGNVSKVVDENGEPMAVYHGSATWNPLMEYAGDAVFGIRNASTDYDFPSGAYFSDSWNISKTYSFKNQPIGLFLNIKKPLIFNAGGRSYNDAYDDIYSQVRNLNKSKYDGLIWKNIRDDWAQAGNGGETATTYVAFDPAQIKSATDNIGTYSRNPDIRWRIEEGAAELDARHAELYERYKGGDEAAYGEALELVADEARRKGYDVKVYHGTGADGFNVAKADASEARYGEGAQAHGPGLYMAASRDIAEGYMQRAGGGYFTRYELNGRDLDNTTLSLSARVALISAKKRNANIEELIEGNMDNPYRLATYRQVKAFLDAEHATVDDVKIIEEKTGNVFDWFHNMKPDELLDEEKPLDEQPRKVKQAIISYYKSRPDDYIAPDNEDSPLGSMTGAQFLRDVIFQMRREGKENPYQSASDELLKHGIRGITYYGGQDGRCFVSFEGGATVKLQDPFTFDDEGNLIPLSERFDEANPDMRWKIDDPSPERVEKLRAARPVEIGENDYKGLYELNAKSAREYVLKKLRGRKYINADTGDKIEISQVGARKISSHDRYNKDYLRTFAAIPQMIENAVYLGEEPNEKGNGKYDKYRYYACGLKIGGRDYTARLTIGELKGKWYYDQALTEMEKGDLIERLLKLSKPVWPLTGSPNGFIDNRLISLLQENNSENFSRLRFLLRQDRRENPVIWASIALAKQILLGRAITNARLDRVLPPERFDGTKREYAVNRAREIAERYRADKEKFGNDLNLGVQRAENDLYWTRDVVEEMYASFRRDGEEYGIARQRLMEWLKEQRRRDLETVKGLSSEELGIDVPAAIEDALEKEPERRKPGENAAEESGEETFEASGEGIDAEIENAREKPAPSAIRDIIGKIRMRVTKAAKARGMDEAARRRAYRNTLAEVLRESAKRLTYGREREAIMKKISDLSAKGYSVIKIKDGERAGQKIDNYTLRAEHIALRIFNRGVRDTKRELSEKFEKIVSRRGKKPSRMERDDKRALAGAVQMRVYNIKRYSEMDAAELEAEYSATVDRLENVEKNFTDRIRHYGAFAKAISKEIRKRAAIVQYGLPPFPASDIIQYRPLCGQSERRKREQKSSNPKMRCITCESDKTLARLISIKLDFGLYASAPDSYCHASLAA